MVIEPAILQIMIGALVFVALVLAWLWRRPGNRARVFRQTLPRELRRARLVGHEVPVHVPGLSEGRADSVYQLRDGSFVVVERKRRRLRGRKPYLPERVQISLCALGLHQQGKPVAPYGYLASTTDHTYLKVPHLSSKVLQQLIARAYELDGQPGAAVAAPQRAKCFHCGHRRRCPAAA